MIKAMLEKAPKMTWSIGWSEITKITHGKNKKGF
jgi:hypothetical protein